MSMLSTALCAHVLTATQETNASSGMKTLNVLNIYTITTGKPIIPTIINILTQAWAIHSQATVKLCTRSIPVTGAARDCYAYDMATTTGLSDKINDKLVLEATLFHEL